MWLSGHTFRPLKIEGNFEEKKMSSHVTQKNLLFFFKKYFNPKSLSQANFPLRGRNIFVLPKLKILASHGLTEQLLYVTTTQKTRNSQNSRRISQRSRTTAPSCLALPLQQHCDSSPYLRYASQNSSSQWPVSKKKMGRTVPCGGGW
jgi:hypothetical protein